MEWFSRNFEIPNWTVVLAAVVIILLLYSSMH
jgi:hypothetical protein